MLLCRWIRYCEFAIFASVLLIYAVSVLGADVPEAELLSLAPLSLEELVNLPVVTASRQREVRSDTPAHILVITREQIRERRYKNLADLLEDLPGVNLMRGTKSSAYNNFSFQGYVGANKLLILLDGVRIGHPAGGNIPVADNFSLYLARQVEILYGPAAALYGADAAAGVINIITDDARDRDESMVSLGIGSFSSREASFLTGIMSEEHDVAVNLGGHWQRSDRAPLDEYYRDEFVKQDAETFTGHLVVPAAQREDYVGNIESHSLYARVDVGDDLTFGYYRNFFDSLTSTGDPPETALYLRNGHWQTTTDTVYGKYRFDLAPTLSGELIADFSHQEVDPSSKYVNIFTAFTEGNEYVRAQRLSIEQNLNWKIDDMHRVQAGIGYQSYYAVEAHSLPLPYDTSRDPDEQGQYYRNTDGTIPIDIYDASYRNASLYAQIQSDWSERFSTMLGARFDHHSAYGDSVNPRLGAVWHPSEPHYLKLLYGEAFRAPSPEEILSSFGTFDGTKNSDGKYVGAGFRIPNFDLEPEKVRTLSLTWDWRPRPNLNIVLNAYRSEIKNLVVTQPSSDMDRIPGAVLILPETKGNAGKETHTGFDLMAQWRYRIGPAWSGDLWGSVSKVWGRTDEGDGVEWDLAYAADFAVKLGTTLRYRDRLTITPKLYWIGDTTNGRKDDNPISSAPYSRKTPDLISDATNAHKGNSSISNAPYRLKTPGYTVVDLHIGWHKLFNGRSTLWFDIYNLFDARYYAAGGSGSRTFYDMPQQPRSAMVSLEFRF